MKELLEFIEVIYDAPSNPGSGWHDLIEKFGTRFPHCKTVLGTYHNGEVSLTQSASDISDELLVQYSEYYGLVNPIVEPLMNTHSGKYFDADQFVNRKSFLKTEYYNDFLRPLGNMDRNIGVVLKNDQSFSTFCTHYADHHSKAKEQNGLEHYVVQMMPHLQRSLNLQREIESLRLDTGTLSDVLDVNKAASFIVNASGTIRYQNAAAQALLQDGSVIRATHDDRLFIFFNGHHDDFSRQIIAAASLELNRLSADAEPLMVVSSSGQRHIITVQPAPSSAKANYATALVHERRAIITVKNIDQIPIIHIETVAKILNITEAESELSLALYKGQTLHKYAMARKLSIHTVRGQIKSVFRKTDTRSQSGLVALIGQIAAD